MVDDLLFEVVVVHLFLLPLVAFDFAEGFDEFDDFGNHLLPQRSQPNEDVSSHYFEVVSFEKTSIIIQLGEELLENPLLNECIDCLADVIQQNGVGDHQFALQLMLRSDLIGDFDDASHEDIVQIQNSVLLEKTRDPFPV